MLYLYNVQIRPHVVIKHYSQTSSSPPSTTPVTPGRVTRASAAGISPSVAPAGEPSGKKKRGRKRKASAGSFKISDYMDSQVSIIM